MIEDNLKNVEERENKKEYQDYEWLNKEIRISCKRHRKKACSSLSGEIECLEKLAQ